MYQEGHGREACDFRSNWCDRAHLASSFDGHLLLWKLLWQEGGKGLGPDPPHPTSHLYTALKEFLCVQVQFGLVFFRFVEWPEMSVRDLLCNRRTHTEHLVGIC